MALRAELDILLPAAATPAAEVVTAKSGVVSLLVWFVDVDEVKVRGKRGVPDGTPLLFPSGIFIPRQLLLQVKRVNSDRVVLWLRAESFA
jgi:hypothetical protein